MNIDISSNHRSRVATIYINHLLRFGAIHIVTVPKLLVFLIPHLQK